MSDQRNDKGAILPTPVLEDGMTPAQNDDLPGDTPAPSGETEGAGKKEGQDDDARYLGETPVEPGP